MADSDTTQTEGDRRRRPAALTVALWLALAGLAAFAYVLFSAVSKPDLSGMAAFRTGSLSKLDLASAGTPMPTRPILDPQGSPTALSSMKGRVVVMNLWASWCAPCIEEMPTLAALQKSYPASEVMVATVSMDAPALTQKSRAMLEKLGGGALPFFHDPASGLAFDVRAPGLPTTVVYGKDGREVARVAGKADWSSPEAKALIDEARRR